MTPSHSPKEPLAVAPPSRGSLLVIFLTVFIDLLGFAMVLPLLPIYAQQFGEDKSGLWVGVLMASFSMMQFLFSPWWGALSDRWGRRPVLLLGLLGAAIFYAAFGVATLMKSVTGLFVSRIGAGIACATIPVAQAYIADSTSLKNRTKGMALIGAAFGIGFCFGPLVGAGAILFSENVQTSPWPGFTAAGLSLAAFLLALVKLPESLRAESQSASHGRVDRNAWFEAWQTPSIAGLLLASFVSVLSFGGFETTLSSLLKDPQRGFALDLPRVLYYFSYVGIVLTLVQGGLVRRLAVKWNESVLANLGMALSLLGFALLIPAAAWKSFPLLMLATAVEVGGFAFLTPSLQSLLSRRSDPAKQGSIAGISQSVGAMARIAGPLLAFPLFQQNVTLPYVVALVLMLLSFAVLQMALRRGYDYGATHTQ